jgi:RNA recognition motif-containing protein
LRIADDKGSGVVGSAILEFAHPDFAAEAIRTIDGLEFAGRRLRVTSARRSSS